MIVIAFVPPPSDPQLANMAYGGMLGSEWEVHAYRDQEEVPDDVASRAEYILAAAGPVVDARLIKRAPNLRLIQVPGHGFDHVSLEDAAAAGVPVATVASSGAEAHTVAEMAILLAGVAGRRILEGDAFVRRGEWGPLVFLQRGIFELAGKTIGLVGFGKIGREVAKRARGFDMRVLYHDVYRPGPDVESELGVAFAELDDLLRESDIVSLHAPLTPETTGMIDDRALSLMKPTAILVNTARGPLVNADALARALREKRIRAAGIDVLDPEPPKKDNPLLGLDEVVLSPHMAGVTAESLLRILQAALENIRRVVRGEQPLDVVTPGTSH